MRIASHYYNLDDFWTKYWYLIWKFLGLNSQQPHFSFISFLMCMNWVYVIHYYRNFFFYFVFPKLKSLHFFAGFVNTILSWKAFIPLSRLTYCAYLVHPIILQSFYLSQRYTIYITDFEIVSKLLMYMLRLIVLFKITVIVDDYY